MTTICTECGKRIQSVFGIESVIVLWHLQKNHPNLFRMFVSSGMTQMTGSINLESGKTIHFVGEKILEYEEDEDSVTEIS